MVFGSKSRTPDTRWSWVVCASTTITTFLHYGISLSFGVFLPVLSEYFHANKEKTAWAGSIALSLTKFSGLFAVTLVSRFGHRATAIGGGLLCSVSLICSSFVDDLRILYFSYGVLFGLGAGIILNTCLTVNNLYFKKNPALPTGIMTMGSTLGVIVFGPCLQELVEAVQWRNTFRIMGGVLSLICFLSITYDPIKTDVRDEEDAKKISLSFKECMVLFTNWTFTVGLISSMLAFLGVYVPFVHLIQFAKDMKIPSREAAQLFIYIGICSSLSRIVIGKILDKAWLTPLRSLQLVSLIIGLSIVFLSFAKEYMHFIIFAVVYGFANGAFITTCAVFCLSVAGRDRAHISLSIGYMFCAITVCGGPPFIGFIADKLGSYIPSFYIAGGIVTFASVFPFVLLFCNNTGKAEYRLEEVELQSQEDRSEDEKTHRKTFFISSV